MKFFLISCLVLLLVLFACKKKEFIPSSPCGSLFGWGFSLEGFPISNEQLNTLEEETKICSQFIQFYLQWPASSDQFQPLQSSLNAIANKGAIPCITWEPMNLQDNIETMIPFHDILNGEYDNYLMKVAYEIKSWNKPLIIRFAHEMNLDRYHWGGTLEQFNAKTPEQYISVFRYIVSLFKKQGATQVLWAFCPNVDSLPKEEWNNPAHYYPGDKFVDILGMDGYNWDVTEEVAKEKNLKWTKPWISFEKLFGDLYQTLKDISPNKPMIVFETSTVDRKGNQKQLWIQEAIRTAKKWNVSGIIWFQIHKEENWLINQRDDLTYVPIIRSATNPFEAWFKKDLK